MAMIENVNKNLRFFLDKIQGIYELDNFLLAGGTNLALRFDHRVSVDIDLLLKNESKTD